ncbi:protelomerase family protein [Microcoleus sp. S13_C5]
MTVSQKIINKAQEFFNRVSVLDDRTAVSRACHELLDEMRAEYSLETINTDLTEFRKPFKKFIHANPELNDIKRTKNKGAHKQHCAVDMLVLTDEEKKQVNQQKLVKTNARAGFDTDGNFREVDIPKCDIEAIVLKSVECLTSEDPLVIACGIVNLTGLRAGEQNQPKYYHEELETIIERQIVVLGEFLIGVKGISKKQNLDDVSLFYARPTLAPAQLIVDAQRRYLKFKVVQEIPTDIDKYQKGFQKQFRNRYYQIFGTLLSTIEAFDDNSKLKKPNGSPHKGRSFYASALKNILRHKGFNSNAILTYVQLALAHEGVSETLKYVNKYDEDNFINPININIPLNINELGKMEIIPVIETPVATNNEGFNLDEFLDGMTFENNMKYVEFLENKGSITKAILALIDYLSVNKKFVDKAENSLRQQPTTQQPASQQPVSQQPVSLQSASDESTSKESVTAKVAQIVETIMHYNRQIFNGENVEELAVPNYGLINKINLRLYNKNMASTTVKAYTDKCKEQSAELEQMGIVGGFDNIAHNGKYYRKTMDELVARILEYNNN